MSQDPTPLEYEFLAPPKIVFGWGRRRDAGKLARSLGQRAFLIIGSRTLERSGAVGELTETIQAAGVSVVLAGRAEREPTIEDVDAIAAKLRDAGAGAGDIVIALGGGSSIDLAKAAAAMAVNRQSPTVRDYLEGIGRGLELSADPLPVMAMPTTAGTGSEATKNAVISCADPPVKKSLRSERMIPRIVLVDPQLGVSTPPDVTAHSGMDAITQLIESYLSKRAKPIPQALCASGLRMAVPAIVEAYRDGQSRPARERMAHAALLSGIALANSGLGMAHGVAAALGALCGIRHGLACAVMLPAALRANRDVRRAELAQLATELSGKTRASEAAAADAVIERMEGLCQSLKIPRRLSDLGVRGEQIPALVAGSKGNSMDGNPRAIPDDELADILEQML